jgi:hypothetical protein
MVRIANPIYDTVFKHLMDNQEVAMGLISCLMRVKVHKLEPKPQEVLDHTTLSRELEGNRLRIFRLDFAADIETQDGLRMRVIIEIQKANSSEAIDRFRAYLGNTYRSATSEDEPLPIVAIYFLGFYANRERPPVVVGKNSLLDGVSQAPLPPDKNPNNDAFFKALVHDAIFVQIPALHKLTGRSELELALRLFNQSFISENRHFLTLSEEAIGNAPPWLTKAFRILLGAASDAQTQELMGVEDQLTRLHQRNERKIEAERRQKEEALHREQEERRLKEAALRREETANARLEAALRELEELKRLTGS